MAEPHEPDCRFRKALLCPVGIECEHSFDVCPTCDPCTCAEIRRKAAALARCDAEKNGRKGDWIQTYTGVIFYPLDPRPEEIRIEDIAHALSNQCRFAGHCREFYSVAEHSVRVSIALGPRLALWGLLHDAAEAYLVDLPRPIKRYAEFGTLYQAIENNLMLCVCDKFGITRNMPPAVKRMDTRLLVTEKRDLMNACPKPWEDTEEPLPDPIWPMAPHVAERLFLHQFRILYPGQAEKRAIEREDAK
jgi:hypothetical protein